MGQRRDALGGDLFCSLMAALNFQLPHEGLRAAGVHGHLFLNGGTLVGLGGGSGRSLQQCAHELATTLRWTVVSGRSVSGVRAASRPAPCAAWRVVQPRVSIVRVCRELAWPGRRKLAAWSLTSAAC